MELFFLFFIRRQWSSTDKISLHLPISLRMEGIQGPVYRACEKGDSPEPTNKSNGSTFALSHTTNTMTMQKLPEPGSASSVFTTFRLIFTEHEGAISLAVMLEPYSLPGAVHVHQGRERSLGIDYYSVNQNSVFHMVYGDEGMVRLEAESEEGCFVCNSGGMVKLECDSSGSDYEVMRGTSFMVRDGISHYHPISIVSKGLRRNFLLQPLFSLRDEHYTVYTLTLIYKNDECRRIK